MYWGRIIAFSVLCMYLQFMLLFVFTIAFKFQLLPFFYRKNVINRLYEYLTLIKWWILDGTTLAYDHACIAATLTIAKTSPLL
jgi:hypothetical protein